MTMKLVVFGKGGIGKSTTCSNLAAAYSKMGKKVLLVGCDPKHDTTINLTDGKPIKTAVEMSGFLDLSTKKQELIVQGRLGVDCIESGGPEPGIGCAGRGISRTIEMMESCGLMKDDHYDIMIFDVLGDVVCGGFAAPLKLGFADKVAIVSSEELMALYACNNICRAMVNYASNGVGLCGIIANLKDHEDLEVSGGTLRRFADLVNTDIIDFLPRDIEVRKAEYERKTVIDYNPRAKFAKKIEELCVKLMEIDVKKVKMPIPLSDREFLDMSRVEFKGERVHKEAGRAAQIADESVFQATNVAAEKRKEKEKALAKMKANNDEASIPETAEEDDKLERILSTWVGAKNKVYNEGPHAKVWGNPEQWRMFFADFETMRNQEQQTYMDTPIIGVSHEDLECNYATPYYDDGHMVPFNVPWANRWKNGSKRRNEGYLCVTTDLIDTDVVAGGGEKLKEGLDMALKNIEGKKAILVKSTCIPTIIGDDADGIIRQYQAKTDIPIVYNNPAADHYEDPMIVLFDQLKKTEAFQKVKPQSRAINLIGFPPGKALDEIKFLLENSGVYVNCITLPRFSVEELGEFNKACVNVFYPDLHQRDLYKQLFHDVKSPGITPVPPYGLRHTKNWLKMVTKAAGGDPRDAENTWRIAVSTIGKRWNEASEKASQSRLGFVVDANKVHRLAGIDGICGVPLVGLLKEMGFGIDYLSYLKDVDAPELKNGKADEKSKHRIRWFNTPEQLHNLMSSGEINAAYSEYVFDKRLTRAGVPQFSLLDIEMGLRGALRSMKKLQRVCDWKLYKICTEKEVAI